MKSFFAYLTVLITTIAIIVWFFVALLAGVEFIYWILTGNFFHLLSIF